MADNICSCNGVFLVLYDFLVMNQNEHLLSLSGLSLERMSSFLQVVEAGNIAKAALGDATKQSQFSRQIKEMESFFGVALTRRVGRRIEITDEGHRLALIIRRQFRELEDFRAAMAGKSVQVRFGAQGSIIEWILTPRINEIRKALGDVTVELEQMRTLDVMRAVADGRIDFGILRVDALPKETKRWKLGTVGYALFAAKTPWKPLGSVERAIEQFPMVELLPGGQFGSRWQEWLAEKKLRPQIIARLASFTQMARVVRTGKAAAVLPEIATVELDPKQFHAQTINGLPQRTMALIANPRSLERAGLNANATSCLEEILALDKVI